MNDPPNRRRAATTKQTGSAAVEPAGVEARVALVVVHSPDPRVAAIPLSSGLTVVGRDVQGAGVSFDDERMSRVHFRIAFDGRARSHRLGDARSKNGTFVGGARVDTAVLRPGDVLRAGDTVFVYGDPDPMSAVRDRVARLGPSDLSVLLLGETGTGKERTAKAIHEASGRSGPFVAVNCAALPGSLLTTELFGHTRGAFSGATDTRRGLFQTASGGTLFLDEIADAPLELQAVLLRALEEHVVRPIGSDREVAVDARVIAATHGDLDVAVRENRFRADLHARLAHVVVRLPPVRERRAEVLKMSAEFAKENGREWSATADAAEALVRHSWRYNAREVENVVRGFLTLGNSPTMDSSYLKEHHPDIVAGFRSSAGTSLENGGPRPAESIDRASLEALLAKHRGNVSAVADEMGRPRPQVYRMLRALGLDPERYRP
jgi:DNA-binding NtrC family response regulator